MATPPDQEAFEWQMDVWDRMSDCYLREVDRRFEPIVEGVITRAALMPGERVLDLGTGTGSVSLRAAQVVGPHGNVVGTDISSEMLALARKRAAGLGLANLGFTEGPAEAIPVTDSDFDVVLASLSLMYVIDRNAAAQEIARVLRPGGRLVASLWAAPNECDIVLFQQTAGRFAPTPPVPGVGPGAMADTTEFLNQLTLAGINAAVEREVYEFEFDDFDSAWDVLAGVTTAQLPHEVQQEAKNAVARVMWNQVEQPRQFRNTTQFIVGQRSIEK